jgi:hypothetical protein
LGIIDLGAERVIGAQKGSEEIAVEVKSFVGQAAISVFHEALGQYKNYLFVLEETDPNRDVYLAVPHDSYTSFFSKDFIQKVIRRESVKMIIYDPFFEKNCIMDQINQYRAAILDFLRDQAGIPYHNAPGLRSIVVSDDITREYLLICTGWDHGSYRDHIIIHFSISEKGQIWVNQNNTELQVGNELRLSAKFCGFIESRPKP